MKLLEAGFNTMFVQMYILRRGSRILVRKRASAKITGPKEAEPKMVFTLIVRREC